MIWIYLLLDICWCYWFKLKIYIMLHIDCSSKSLSIHCPSHCGITNSSFLVNVSNFTQGKFTPKRFWGNWNVYCCVGSVPCLTDTSLFKSFNQWQCSFMWNCAAIGYQLRSAGVHLDINTFLIYLSFCVHDWQWSYINQSYRPQTLLYTFFLLHTDLENLHSYFCSSQRM